MHPVGLPRPVGRAIGLGPSAAAHTPWSARAAINIYGVSARPPISEARANPVNETISTRPAPYGVTGAQVLRPAPARNTITRSCSRHSSSRVDRSRSSTSRVNAVLMNASAELVSSGSAVFGASHHSSAARCSSPLAFSPSSRRRSARVTNSGTSSVSVSNCTRGMRGECSTAPRAAPHSCGSSSPSTCAVSLSAQR